MLLALLLDFLLFGFVLSLYFVFQILFPSWSIINYSYANTARAVVVTNVLFLCPGNITLKAQNYTRWVTRIFNKGLCRPVEMILNLEREGKMDSTGRSAKALVRVKKCHLLYASPINQENVTCVAVKENARLIPIEV